MNIKSIGSEYKLLDSGYARHTCLARSHESSEDLRLCLRDREYNGDLCDELFKYYVKAIIVY